MKQRPNLFDYATKELSQDGFFSWLILWADDDCKTQNLALHTTAKDFVKMITGKQSLDIVHKVDVCRQWNKIDIVATINDDSFVAIEDKTYTGTYPGQLDKYKEIVVNYCNENKLTPYFVYLKMGNECLHSLQEIEEKGYRPIRRADVLDILKKREVENDIFNDFKKHLMRIEAETLDYANFNHSILAAQGFYIELEKLIDNSKWQYVPNRGGGFWDFDFCCISLESKISEETTPKLWIQIENQIKKRVQLTVKTVLGSLDRKEILRELNIIGEKYGISLNFPSNYRRGRTSTLAVVPYDFSVDADGNFDFHALANTLKKLESILNEYKNSK